MKYNVYYNIEGCISIEADSEDEAREKFDDVSDRELVWNAFNGTEISDIRRED